MFHCSKLANQTANTMDYRYLVSLFRNNFSVRTEYGSVTSLPLHTDIKGFHREVKIVKKNNYDFLQFVFGLIVIKWKFGQVNENKLLDNSSLRSLEV